MVSDHVVCNNCCEEMFVIPGTEVCPKCKVKGVLSWVNEDEQEVEVSENEIINLDDYDNVVNETEEFID